MRGAARVVVLLTALLTGLAGCGRYYWFRPDTAPAAFVTDSDACARETARSGAVLTPGVAVDERAYRRCMEARGYRRAQQVEPVPAGWYRGLE